LLLDATGTCTYENKSGDEVLRAMDGLNLVEPEEDQLQATSTWIVTGFEKDLSRTTLGKGIM
jgi:hypothetical protein